MGFSAIIPAAELDAANAALEAAGFGPGNFSVPLCASGGGDTTHYGLNSLGYPEGFWAAILALPGVSMRDAPQGTVEFFQHVEAEGLAVYDKDAEVG